MNVTKFAAFAVILTTAAAHAQVTRHDAQKLVELAKSRNNSVAVAALQSKSPTDARLPYLAALSRVDRNDYRGALEQVKHSLQLNPANLDAWKVRIWLSMATKDFNDAATSMDWLSSRMPANGATPEAEMACVEFARFMGKSFGYMNGPQGDRASVASLEQRVVGRLSGNRKSAFVAAHSHVTSDYNQRLSHIETARKVAQQNEEVARRDDLQRLSEESRYANSELTKIEDTRLQGRQLAANERNVIAATREEAAGGTLAGAATNFRKVDLRNPIFDDTKEDPTIIGHNVNRRSRLNHRSSLASGYAVDRGLDNWHYLNVNQREAQENERLADRERDMQRRLRRIAKDKAKQINRPNAGMTASVRAAIAKAKSLSAYLDFPVSTKSEIANLVAAY